MAEAHDSGYRCPIHPVSRGRGACVCAGVGARIRCVCRTMPAVGLTLGAAALVLSLSSAPAEPEPAPEAEARAPWIVQLRPHRHLWELGGYGGLFIVHSQHDFYDLDTAPQQA